MAVQQADIDAAQALAAEHTRSATSIGNRGELTSLARRQLLALNYLTFKQKMAALEAKATADTTSQVQQIERALFGLDDLVTATTDRATLDISFRDALDRVSRLDPTREDASEAADLLLRANRSGDEVLARAIAAHAYDLIGPNAVGQGLLVDPAWRQVLQMYGDTHPAAAAGVQKLIDLATIPTGEWGTHVFAFVLPAPLELMGTSETEILRLAQNAFIQPVPGTR